MRLHALAAAIASSLLTFAAAQAADVRHLTLSYDQPRGTGIGIGAEIFAKKLAELSKDTLVVDLFPGAQLGQDPQAMQKVRTGDIDFSISATANLATLTPQSGVLSLHYLFKDDAQLARAIADPDLLAAVQKLFDETVQGGHVMTLLTLGLRELYGKKEIHKVEDLARVKVRVQATATEDTIFAAYGAQTVHMPFGSVYTSLQTGVIDMAENGINVYQQNKHYEVAPVMSLTGHEANILTIWMSDKTLQSLTAEQQGWVKQAAAETGRTQPALAIQLEHTAQALLQKLGVKFVEVDKTGFIQIAEPIQDKIAAELGPHAVRILQLSRAVK
jgi:tripartite ATP-independent transporter DctP family solute receptor